jgi:hypothetical protein
MMELATKLNESAAQLLSCRRRLENELTRLRGELREAREQMFVLCCSVQNRINDLDGIMLSGLVGRVRGIEWKISEIEDALSKLPEYTEIG